MKQTKKQNIQKELKEAAKLTNPEPYIPEFKIPSSKRKNIEGTETTSEINPQFLNLMSTPTTVIPPQEAQNKIDLNFTKIVNLIWVSLIKKAIVNAKKKFEDQN